MKKQTLYTVRSDESGYVEMLREVLKGNARVMREQFLPGGVIERTYQVGPTKNPMIEIGSGFFQNAVRDYSGWKLKWWRECIQNAVDAGAKNIRLEVEYAPEGYLVSCEDDGRGMSRDIMLNKFLVLGETGKEDRSGQIGGFGKAKELLILPWIRWMVESGDTHIEGSGLPYEVTKSKSFRKGTLLQVLMPLDLYTTETDAIEYLQRCDVSGSRFFVGGEQFKEKLSKGTFVKDLPFGKLYHNKKSTVNSVYVRINGLYMFPVSTYRSGIGAVVVELEGDSTKLLTANRDTFRSERDGNVIYDLVNELATEGETALKEKSGLITEIYAGNSRMSNAKGMLDVLDAIGPLPPVEKNKAVKLDTAMVEALVEFLSREPQQSQQDDQFRLPPPSDGVVKVVSQVPITGQASLESFAQQLVWQPDFMVKNDIAGFHVPEKFKPRRMSKKLKDLMTVWAEACRWVLIQLNSTAEYGVGFVFSDQYAAMYANVVSPETRTVNWLLLNPFKNVLRREDTLNILDERDVQDIYASAIHEVTHMADGYHSHNHSFAGQLTTNMARCVAGWPMMKKIAAAVRKSKGKETIPEWQVEEPWESEAEPEGWDEERIEAPAKRRAAPKPKDESSTPVDEEWAYNVGLEWASDVRSEKTLIEAAKGVVGKKKTAVDAFVRGLRAGRGVTKNPASPIGTQTRISVDFDAISELWWKSALAQASRAPQSVRRLLTPRGPHTALVSGDEANAAWKWASSLPGWKGTTAGHPYPLKFESYAG